MWLDEKRSRSFFVRRRAILGPVGCGLCGIESLEQACPAPPQVANGTIFRARDLLNAMRGLAPLQGLNQKARSMHAAAFWEPSRGIGPVREESAAITRSTSLPARSYSTMRRARSVRSLLRAVSP